MGDDGGGYSRSGGDVSEKGKSSAFRKIPANVITTFFKVTESSTCIGGMDHAAW